MSSRSGLAIEVDVDLAFEAGREPTRHTPELEATVYRTVQEALTNVVKHAEARSVRVLIEERDDVLTITVADDGRGFDDSAEHDGFRAAGNARAGRSGRRRADHQLTRGRGTRVTATLPVTRVSA